MGIFLKNHRISYHLNMSRKVHNTKNPEKKNRKNILGQNCLKQIMSQPLDFEFLTPKKLTKSRKKIEKTIFGSELSEPNKITPKKLTKNLKKIDKLFLAQSCLKQIMGQLLNHTKKIDKTSRKKSKNYFWVRIV